NSWDFWLFRRFSPSFCAHLRCNYSWLLMIPCSARKQGMCFAKTGNSSVATGNCSTLILICLLLQISRPYFLPQIVDIYLYHRIANLSSFAASSFRCAVTWGSSAFLLGARVGHLRENGAVEQNALGIPGHRLRRRQRGFREIIRIFAKAAQSRRTHHTAALPN